ncbi:hypothetical protein GM3709_3676 [Geminocystis sp. NIES-3709]|nr:hypothetical protein GM3709_3676 [Geminocystis sp. NIES-3709]
MRLIDISQIHMLQHHIFQHISSSIHGTIVNYDYFKFSSRIALNKK